MRAPLLTLLVLFAPAGSAMGADHSPSTQERAKLLREIRDQMDASQPAGTELYRRYFDAFPSSFTELGELLVSDRYSEILLRPGEKWDFGLSYIVLMCQSYDRIDHRRYMRKLLRIGVGANNWGEAGKDNEKYVYPGDTYFRLIARYPCGPQTQESVREQQSVIYALVPEFTDAELEAIYNSLSWEGSPMRSPLDWFLDGICSRYPNRCALTRMLHEKYVKHLYDDPRPH
jgi:hypothetical protein